MGDNIQTIVINLVVNQTKRWLTLYSVDDLLDEPATLCGKICLDCI